MKEMLNKIHEIEKLPHIAKRQERLRAELQYAWQLAKKSECEDGPSEQGRASWKELVEKAVKTVTAAEQTGNWTEELVAEVEEILSPMAQAAKEYRIICPAHAHIDMNWQWSYDETVMTTLDTMQTMLDILDEYPEFKFSQSQASVYQIVEEYAPHMLEKIRGYIKAGRWEVTASTWVEADKNMPVGESLARHSLYTKSYLAELLDLDPDSLNIDFEPDTFGHSRNIPEIAEKSGVKYYYHCRGNDGGYFLYRWRSPSGAELIAYRDPFFYLGNPSSQIALSVLDMAQKTGCKTLLRVYGVGDHGGGPTRRDVECLLEMSKWPIFPDISLGTFGEYFREAEKMRDRLPVVDEEINFICDGCYSSQSRIKAGNIRSERNLQEAETFEAFSGLMAGWPKKEYRSSWKKVLFQQFHDILTGSCMPAAREYACGQYQLVEADTRAGKKQALQKIAEQIDTSSLIQDRKNEIAVAAGFGHDQAEARGGKNRIYHLFNSNSENYSGCVEIYVWDYENDAEHLIFRDLKGNILESQLLERSGYWGHFYDKFLIYVRIPAFGYLTVVTEQGSSDIRMGYVKEMCRQHEERFVLENEYIKAILDNMNPALISLVDKTTGREKLDRERGGAHLCIIDEAGAKPITGWNPGMSSWFVGRHKMAETAADGMELIPGAEGPLRNSFIMKMKMRDSSFTVEIGLDRGSRDLDYLVHCDWREFGCSENKIPSLAFQVSLSEKAKNYYYDVPFGMVSRGPVNLDRPANSFVTADNGLMVMSEARYGYRCTDSSICLKLLRSSTDPDPVPEIGQQDIRFALSLADDMRPQRMLPRAQAKYRPISVISGRPHAGTMPDAAEFFKKTGETVLSSVKPAEYVKNAWTVRLYEVQGVTAKETLKFPKPVRRACLTDLTEQHVYSELKIEGNTVFLEVLPCQVATVIVEFQNDGTMIGGHSKWRP